MAVNKVVINQNGVENVLVDITDSTVTPETLAEGETAYGANGEKIVGAMKPGIDTSDATATAAHIVEKRTAYVKGEKITGTMPYTGRNVMSKSEVDRIIQRTEDPGIFGGATYVAFQRRQPEDRLFMKDSVIEFCAEVASFGDATPADVARGKKFTSASGFNMTGTGSTSLDVTDDGNGNLTIANARVTYNNGDLHITT